MALVSALEQTGSQTSSTEVVLEARSGRNHRVLM